MIATEQLTFKQITEKYPLCFKGSCDSGVGNGWLPYVEEVCEVLERYRKYFPNITIGQVKEKFGDFRLYLDINRSDEDRIKQKAENGDLWYRGLEIEIEDIERRVSQVCEYCGSKVDVKYTTSGWVKKLCGGCRRMYENA